MSRRLLLPQRQKRPKRLLNNISVSWNPLGSHSHIKKKGACYSAGSFLLSLDQLKGHPRPKANVSNRHQCTQPFTNTRIKRYLVQRNPTIVPFCRPRGTMKRMTASDPIRFSYPAPHHAQRKERESTHS